MQVYTPKVVAKLNEFYQERFIEIEKYASIYNHLEVLAQRMYEGVITKENCTFTQLNNHHPNYLGVAIEKLKEQEFSLEDCQLSTAKEYGFSDWSEVEKMKDTSYNLKFEKAVNILLKGNLDLLKEMISKNPELIKQTSQYVHQATLLHYTASNGVEMWRQQVPLNLAEIIQFLLENGSDKDAKMKVYGGEFDTKSLMAISAHPADAGVMEEVLRLL